MFYDDSTHQIQLQSGSVHTKRNPRVDYVNVSHSQTINHTIKTRTQRDHDSLINQMLDAASLGATEKARLKGHTID